MLKSVTCIQLTLPLVLALLNACGGGDSNVAVAVVAPSALSYPSPRVYTAGTTITTLDPTVSGTVTSYSVAPALPAGLALNTQTGQISGTPGMPAAMAGYTVRAGNAAGSTSFTLTITIDAAPELRIEPGAGTTIGINQVIDLYAAFKLHSTDSYPVYLDGNQVTWASSRPAVALVNGNGQVHGLSEGTTTVSAQYQSLTFQVPIAVGGTYSGRTVAVAGQGNRNYSVLVPSGVAAGTALPVLLGIHGGGGTARINASTTLLSALAQERKILVVYPEGTGAIQTFNAGSCCGGAQANNVDDVSYFGAVLDDIAARNTIDATRIYVTGFSNGGMMSYRLACAMSDRIAGIAAVGGASGQFDQSLNQYYSCNPARPIPVLHVHATNDRNYPYAGGYGVGISNVDFYSVDSTIADWIARNNVMAQGVATSVTPTTTCTRYATPADVNLPSAAVTLCREDPPDVYDPATEIVFGGGHSWPGGSRSPSASSDTPLQDFNVNAYMWSYFGN
jgi:polyhydroxybutyrate depolymerase